MSSNKANGGAGGGGSNKMVVQRARALLEATQKLVDHLEAAHPGTKLGFEPGEGDVPDVPEVRALQDAVLAPLEDVRLLVSGPTRTMWTLTTAGAELAALQVAVLFDFFTAIPEDGSVTAADLAGSVGMDADRAARILRMLATRRVFREVELGRFGHTAVSHHIRSHDEMRAACGLQVDEIWQAESSAAESIRRWPDVCDAEHCAFVVRHGAHPFEYYKSHPAQGARFAKAMAAASSISRGMEDLVGGFDWAGARGTVVDVGGGSGHVSMHLARKFPHLKFIVQDGSPDMLSQGPKLLSEPQNAELADRVSFEQHSFFDAQPAKGAGVCAYFIRQCLHNWSDRDAVKILKAFVPALESSPGACLLINENVLPPGPGVLQLHNERDLRYMDMVMMFALGAKQRTRADFEALLAEADPRYVVSDVHTSADWGLGLIKVELKK